MVSAVPGASKMGKVSEESTVNLGFWVRGICRFIFLLVLHTVLPDGAGLWVLAGMTLQWILPEP